MRPVYHILASASVAAVVYRLSGSVVASGASLATGVLIDLDHLVDYFKARGPQFDWQYFMGGEYFSDNGQIIVPMHSIELLLVLAALTPLLGQVTTLGMAVSFCLHLLMDLWVYPLHPLTYSFIFRWLNRFDLTVLVLEER